MTAPEVASSPDRASCSAANSRIVSSMVNRGSPFGPSWPYQAVIDEGPKPVEDVDAEVGPADGLGRLERPAAAEGRQPGEEPLLLRPEQVMAPLDRPAEGPLPFW